MGGRSIQIFLPSAPSFPLRGGFPKLFLISVLLLAGFILLGRLTCWRKEPAWKTQPFHSAE